MNELKRLMISLALIVATTNPTWASAITPDDGIASTELATANRINAIADFLLGRANDNFMYILQQNMKDNDLLSCYLPETYKYVSSNNLQLLLQSSSTKLWQDSVEDDLKNVGERLIFKELNPEIMQGWAKDLDNRYIEALQKIKVRLDGKEYPVDQIPPDASPELRAEINGFYSDYQKSRQEIDVLIDDLKQHSAGRCPPATSVNNILQNLRKALDGLKAQLSRFKNSDVVWNGNASSTPGTELYKQMVSHIALYGRLKELKEQIDRIQDGSRVEKMFRLDQLIRSELARKDNALVSISDMQEYNRFSNYALSFAILSEANNRDQVKAVLQQLALPPVSFGIKREADAKKIMVSAYFGVQGGTERWGTGYGGLTVPVGLEYSKGLRDGGAVSILLAPFDFAHPINQIINNNNGASTLKDIVNPGVYVTYGIKKYPVIWGAGISRGPSLTHPQDGNKWRYFMFIGMDMPLFSFY